MPGVASSPLTDAEKNDTRRFCGYPARGADGTAAAIFFYSRAFQTLENSMNWLTDASVATVRVYLGQLATLESAVPAAGLNLDTDKAAVWTRNRSEVADRMRLMKAWGRELCNILGVPPGPGLAGAGAAVVV